MKWILVLTVSLLFSISSFAGCDDASDEFLYKILHFNKRPPSKWRTVKGKSYDRNRGTDALLHVGKGVKDSYVIYKGDKYTTKTAEFCVTGKNRIKATHPKHGTVVITRTGKGDKSMLLVTRGLLRGRLRPKRVVRDNVAEISEDF